MSAVDVLAVGVAEASVELRHWIAVRTQAKNARRAEFRRYADLYLYCDGYVYYPSADQYGVEIKDDGCEAAIAAVASANRSVAAARGRWRHATNRYVDAIARIGGAA